MEDHQVLVIPVPKSEKAKSRRPPICRYFNTPQGCRSDEACRFRHVLKQKKNEEQEKEEAPQVVPHAPKPAGRVPVVPTKIAISREQQDSDEQKSALKAEITYFKRRYPRCHVCEKEEGTQEIEFHYQVTDPEWVFDVKRLTFAIALPPAYPVCKPSISAEKNHSVPPAVIRHLQKAIADAVEGKYRLFESRNAYSIIGKELIHWVDRNVLTIFVEGLRQHKLLLQAESAGIKLAPQGQKAAVSSTEPELREEEENHFEEEGDFDDSAEQEEGEAVSASASDSRPVQDFPLQLSIVWKNESQNIASVAPVLLFVILRCVRCREESNKELPATGLRESRCPKCALVHSIRTKAELVHENSNVLARLESRGCSPVDLALLNTHLRFVCLNCNKEDAVQKINYGQNHHSFCKNCHRLCDFVISVACFSGEFAKCALPAHPSSALPKPSKQKNVQTGPIITPGQPLPENGSCKHYKKSYRWFRFPCCGRAFPCDTCHEEANLGHEMKVANRMICGHCSSEQPFVANKPCSKCHENVTRSKSHFWEGGKGCRDPKLMNKNDPHKFAGKKKPLPAKKKAEEK